MDAEWAAQFSDDPERILPEPGPLESAKSYREKKARPPLAKIVKVLCSLYRAYVELKGRYERLQGDYGRVREGSANLSERLQEVKMENKALRGTAADFERVKRAVWPGGSRKGRGGRQTARDARAGESKAEVHPWSEVNQKIFL